MARWIRYEYQGETGFGRLEGEAVVPHSGNLFDSPQPAGDPVPLADVRLLVPVVAGKMVVLWNNSRALAEKLGLSVPEEPLYLLKPASSFLPHGGVIRQPSHYDGKVLFEGDLGIVIGRALDDAGEEEAARAIFGYTIVTDLTAAVVINKDPVFAQWTRAKGYNTFCVFGPAVATGLDPLALRVRVAVDGEERQNYPVTDLVFPPARLISLLSRNMRLDPGDVIACGSSTGFGALPPGARIEVSIDGIGTLANTFEGGGN